MKKVVKIEGLDCPNCAKALEGELNKIKSVQEVKIDFVKQRLEFESEDLDGSLKEIIALTKQLEPDAQIIDKDKKANRKNWLLIDGLTLALGIALSVVIFLVGMPKWAYWTLYAVCALMLGWKTYYKAFRLLCRGIINENLLVTISVIGATFVSEHMEGLMVIALYSLGKIFEGLALERSRKSIEKLAKMQPEYAVVIVEEGEHKVAPASVQVGSLTIVKPGEKVAIDGIVSKGSCFVDMQSLTGESVPVALKEGDEVLSGSIVLDSAIEITTTKNYSNSTISKIMELVENASQNKSKTETVISKISRFYTIGIVILAFVVWGIVWAVTKNIDTAIYRGLIFLVISCPCAFAISVPLAYFSGLGNASKNGVLIKGSNYLDACAKIKTLAFDKTGTLTSGQFVIDKIEVIDKSLSQDDLLYIAALGEQNSLHPLAKSIVAACDKKLCKVDNFKELAGKGVKFDYKGKSYFVGKQKDDKISTKIEVWRDKSLLGEIFLSDSIKDSSFAACKELKSMGIKTVMLSGDNMTIAKVVGDKLGLDEAHGQMLPQDKFDYIQNSKSKDNFVGYVGDGINDAPSLTLADVGISMGVNGSPASVEASDIVLVDDNPQKIVNAIKISKFTRSIVWQNIILSAIVKVVFLTLGSFGVTGMLSAVFADVGVTLLAILNSLRALNYKPRKSNNRQKS